MPKLLIAANIVVCFGSILGVGASDASHEWGLGQIPNPSRKESRSVCVSHEAPSICNPDKILSSEGTLQIQAKIRALQKFKILCPRTGAQTGIQVGIAIVKRIALPKEGNDQACGDRAASPSCSATEIQKSREKAAKVLVHELHNRWGVGDASTGGGGGIVFLIATESRVVHISTGAAAKLRLTDADSFMVIDSMRPMLRAERWDNAVVRALEGIEAAIARNRAETENTGVPSAKFKSAASKEDAAPKSRCIFWERIPEKFREMITRVLRHLKTLAEIVARIVIYLLCALVAAHTDYADLLSEDVAVQVSERRGTRNKGNGRPKHVKKTKGKRGKYNKAGNRKEDSDGFDVAGDAGVIQSRKAAGASTQKMASTNISKQETTPKDDSDDGWGNMGDAGGDDGGFGGGWSDGGGDAGGSW